MSEPDFLDTPQGRRIAFHRTAGTVPTVVFLGGFKSDMTGTKAMALEENARARGQAFLRFDYSGHGQSSGQSSGRFEDGCIGDWTADTLAVLDRVTEGPVVLAGSSMGGWISLLAARARPQRVSALVLIAPAPDFTERMMWANFSDDERRRIVEEGRLEQPSDYSDGPYVITRRLIEDGRKHLLLDRPIPIGCPVRILHGQADADVPWRLSLELMDRLESPDVEATFIKGGDHRLSEPADLERLARTVETVRAHMP